MEENTSKLRKPYNLHLLNPIPCPVTSQNNVGPNTAFSRNKAVWTGFVLHEKQTETVQSASQHNRSQPVNMVTSVRSWNAQNDNSKSIFLHLFEYVDSQSCWPRQVPHNHIAGSQLWPSRCSVWSVRTVPAWRQGIVQNDPTQKMSMPMVPIPSTDMATQFIPVPCDSRERPLTTPVRPQHLEKMSG